MSAAADRRSAPPLERGFRLGDLNVDPQGGEVLGRGGRQQLDPKVMGVLVMLAEHAGHVVARDDLLARLWPNVVVTDEALSRCLYELRRQLSLAGGSDELRAIVETLPKRGYRLNAEVAPLEPHAKATSGSSRQTARIGWGLATAAILVGVALLLNRPGPAESSIAVLPFADMSETQDQGYLADGIAEEILDKLNQATNLRVIARTSSFSFRGTNLSVAEIAQMLDVTHVLEGSVRRSGDSVRVTAQLIATHDSSHLWSSTFERKLGDLFAIQDEIAAAVASALRSMLDLDTSTRPPSPKLAAFDLVKQGEYRYYRRAPGDIQRSIELFEQAIKVDSGYARAWADLAAAYSFQAWSVDPPSEALRAKQGDAALRAVELDPLLAIAQVRLAQYYWESGNETEGRKHINTAKMLDPNNPVVLGYLAADALDADDFETAISLQKRALLRDPMSSVLRQNLSTMLIAADRFEEALSNSKALMAVNPDASPDSEIEIPRMLVLLERHEEAAVAARRLPAGKYRDQALAMLLRAPDHRDEAAAALRRLENYVPTPPMDTPEHTIMDSVRLAEIYAFRGQPDKALAILVEKREALVHHPENAIYTWYLRHEARGAPFLKPLRADPHGRRSSPSRADSADRRPPRRPARIAIARRLALVRHRLWRRQFLRLWIERAQVQHRELPLLFRHRAEIAAAAAAEHEVRGLLPEAIARGQRRIFVRESHRSLGIGRIHAAVLQAEGALAGSHRPVRRRNVRAVFVTDGAAVALSAIRRHFLMLEGSSWKSGACGMAVSAACRSAGGAISLRATRSIHPPSLLMRAATRPSARITSFTSRKREPSAAMSAERERHRDRLVQADFAEILQLVAPHDRPDAALREFGHRKARCLEEAHARVHALVQVGEIPHVRVRIHVRPGGDRRVAVRLGTHIQQWKFSLLPSRSRK